MAILGIFDGSDDTLAHYDEIIKHMEANGLGHPPGRLAHVAARKGNGYIVTDVWESQETLERFQQAFLPLLQQLGIPLPPPQFYPVHNSITRA